MPGSAAPTSRRVARVARFSGTERLAHWLLAITFFVMLGSGLALYLPDLATVVDRPTAKAWHIWSALALPIGLAVLALAGNGQSLARSAAEIDRFDADDLRFLSPARIVTGQKAPPQGRFNAGQKLNTVLTAAILAVLFVTGGLLWLGERDHAYRFDGTVIVHDWGMFALIVLVAGHLYMAILNPSTRHSLRGIMTGEVDRSWAEQHHAKWVGKEPREPPRT